MKTINFFLLFLFCKTVIIAQISYHEPRAVVDEDISKPISCTNNSNSYINKYHDLYNEDLSFWKPTANSTIKTIKVNFIVVQKDDGTGNFSQNGVCPLNPDKTDEEFLHEIIDKVNDIYYSYLDNPSDTGGKSICGSCNDIQDARIRFELQGIHYFQNSSVYGTTNPYYKVNPDSEINIHLNGLNLNYSWANLASFYLSTNHYVFFNRVYQDYCTYGYNAALSLAHLLAHEFGHNLGLCHTYHGGGCPTSNSAMYNSGYYFDDLFGDYPSIFCPDRGGVWNSNPWEDPGDYITNNLMGFTVTRNYLSPKQIAVMQRNLSLKSIRKYVKEDVIDVNPIYITQDETWDFNIKTYSNIIITEGNFLTLSCKVELPVNGKIIVEPGAKLIIDGAEVSIANKNYIWQGIEVHGNTNAYQDEIYQGTVELKNGAVIENAVTGIRAGALKTTLKNGGIARVSNATFKNCVNGIVFQPYRNYNPSNPYQTSKNKSSISRCNFQTTNHLANLGKNPQLFVMLDDVDMIYIKGNTFVNSNPGDYAITGRGKGIYANNASFTATYSCTSQQHPCPEEMLTRA